MSTHPQIPPEVSPDALFSKSRQFIATALAARGASDPSAFPLSAAIALELLAKAALAERHPSLIVDPKNENSLLAAAGFPVETRVATIGADAAYARMKHLVPRFGDRVYKACKKLADARNAHLHSGALPFIGTDYQRWEPDFWYAVELILEAMGRSFEDLLGTEGAALSRSVLAEARIARKAAVSAKIAVHKAQFMALYPKVKARKDAIVASTSIDPMEVGRAVLSILYNSYWLSDCPACSASGVSGGDHSDTLLAEDQDGMDLGWERVVEEYQAAEFLCPSCDLHLRTDDEMYSAGIETTHDEEGEREIEWEPEYGND